MQKWRYFARSGHTAYWVILHFMRTYGMAIFNYFYLLLLVETEMWFHEHDFIQLYFNYIFANKNNFLLILLVTSKTAKLIFQDDIYLGTQLTFAYVASIIKSKVQMYFFNCDIHFILLQAFKQQNNYILIMIALCCLRQY